MIVGNFGKSRSLSSVLKGILIPSLRLTTNQLSYCSMKAISANHQSLLPNWFDTA